MLLTPGRTPPYNPANVSELTAKPSEVFWRQQAQLYETLDRMTVRRGWTGRADLPSAFRWNNVLRGLFLPGLRYYITSGGTEELFLPTRPNSIPKEHFR